MKTLIISVATTISLLGLCGCGGGSGDNSSPPVVTQILSDAAYDGDIVVAAQQLRLNDFQVRVMEDLGPAIYTLMEIDNSTGADRGSRAPLLTVNWH